MKNKKEITKSVDKRLHEMDYHTVVKQKWIRAHSQIYTRLIDVSYMIVKRLLRDKL